MSRGGQQVTISRPDFALPRGESRGQVNGVAGSQRHTQVQTPHQRHGGAQESIADGDEVPQAAIGVVEEQRRCGLDRKSTRLNSSHHRLSRMPSSA